MFRSLPFWGVALVLCASVSLQASNRSFVENPDTTENQALIVGVGHGLSGIDIDLKNVTDIAKNPAYHFKTKQLLDAQGTVSGIVENLTELSEKAGRQGTLMFYFSGHGNVGLIWPQDDTIRSNRSAKRSKTVARTWDRSRVSCSCTTRAIRDRSSIRCARRFRSRS